MKSIYNLTCLPPSVNHIWRHTKGGKTYRTADYMTWQNGEAWNLKAQVARQHKFTGPVYITGALRRPRSNADLDNRLKGIADLLQLVGAIDNDKHIMGWNVWWSADLPKDIAAELAITQADALEAA